MAKKQTDIGKIFVEKKTITPEQLKEALVDQKKTGEKIGSILVSKGYITEDVLLDVLSQQLNIPIEPYRWYVDLRKYGSVPHSGFGLGIERTVCWIAGISHVREAILFPRMLYRIYP